jgi:hypothetical protein
MKSGTGPTRLGEWTMRFVVCARDRQTGATVLVTEEALPNRREAIEAIAGSRDVDRLLEADVFLVDLDAATPVAVIAVSGSDGGSRDVVPEETPEGSTARAEGTDSGGEAGGAHVDVRDVRLAVGEIDIESWTCEDCIYVVTCDKSGSLRPVECASFQWRA